METAKAVRVDQNINVNRGRTFLYAKLTFKDTAARGRVKLSLNISKLSFPNSNSYLDV
jgi:hypothetical protein